MRDLLQDLRHSLRLLVERPDFTAVALLTLALGVGANTAIFSLVRSVLLAPLPFDDPERLVLISETRTEKGWDRLSMSPANFWDLRDQNRSFEEMGALYPTSMNWRGPGYPERLDAATVTAGFLRALGVRPAAGRLFLPGDDDPGVDRRIVVLSYRFWKSLLGADPSIVGSSLDLDGERYEVVGVLPDGEPWLDAADAFVPLTRDPDAGRVSFDLAVVGRLRPGVSHRAALADLEAVVRTLEERYPEDNAGIGVAIDPASDWVASPALRRALWVLFGAVALLLLIACANLANLLLARATGRYRETAVRAALGAGRGRLMRQMLAESTVLSLLGAGIGLVVAEGLIVLVKALDPEGIPRLGDVGLSGPVLAFTLGAALLTGLVTGLAPALRVPYERLAEVLREGLGGSVGSRSQDRLRSGLVVAEVGLCLVVLVGAGLLLRSFDRLLDVDRGFDPDHRLCFAVSLPDAYDRERRGEVRDRFLDRVSVVPQVRAAAAVNMRPLGGLSTGMGIGASGAPAIRQEEVPWATWRMVTDDYFRAMGIPVLTGRTFTRQDQIGEPWRVVLGRRLAERLWPGEDPVGRQAILWKGQDDLPAEVVGVVGDLRERGLDNDPTLAVYLPYYGGAWSPVQFVVHATGDPEALLGTLRSILQDIDPGLPIADVEAMDELVHDSLRGRRLNATLLAVFGAVALLLAVAGVFGVQAYSVARRLPELGVRMALGASPRQLLWLVVARGMRPALIGIGLGLLGAIGLSRLMTGLLFGIAPGDPPTYLGVALTLTVTAVLACYLPGRRALRVDPVTVLREE